MDRLVAEKQTMTEQKVETETAKETEVKAEAQTEEQTDVQSATQETESEQKQEIDTEQTAEEPSTENERYLNSLENITIADYMKREEDKRVEQFEAEKDALVKQQYEKTTESEPEPATEKKQEVSQNIIDKPNYDFIQENEKIVKLSKKEKVKKKPERKRLSLFLSIALGISAIICISNIVAIDQMSSNLAGIEHEFYDVNLPKYLKDIADLDTTKKGMEFVETYPDEEFDAGESGHESNWFDKLCNFLSGLFGG